MNRDQAAVELVISLFIPWGGLPISLLERRANKKTCEKGRHLKPRNLASTRFGVLFHQLIQVVWICV